MAYPDIEKFLTESERRSYLDVKAQGRAEGKAQGRAEGKAEERAASVLRVLAVRRLAVSDAERARIESCRDEAQLNAWLEKAMSESVTSTAELFE